ncbi:tRNA glutamyl-Q(34) synthetase GluQRS [Spiribacter onubensis]|uniref:Glutamyl-Q tRNA(Asp) synthetase n=1 Tax=Spiribacter onubensis TaxID=3122420 RepID=A0ABV3S8R7_9GAMM
MSGNAYVGRFAPSPTGPLHRGSVIAALASYLDARSAGGTWRLRIDDVDSGRARADAAADIRRALEALGLHWDGPVQYQDPHRDQYEHALERLREKRRAYPCACTRREIAAVASMGPAGMIYPGICREGLPAGRGARSWRFAMPAGTLSFRDRHAGSQSLEAATGIGDFIIRRGDGLHAYHLAMVVDDAALGVTDVVRGGDLLPATFPQLALQQSLDLPTPRYLHLPIAVDPGGRKLSKTNGAPPVDLTHPGATLIDALTFLGQSPAAEIAGAPPREVLEWAVTAWRPAHIPRSSEVRV